MLSTQYRLRLEAICKDIASGTEVSLEDMIWANKLGKANTSARGILATPIQVITKGVLIVQMRLLIGSNLTGQTIGDKEIDTRYMCVGINFC